MAQGPFAGLMIRDEWDGGVAIVTVCGEIDMGTAGALRQCLAHVLRKNPDRLVIDLAQVPFLDVSAVRAFAEARRALPAGSPVVLRSPQYTARRVVELTGLAEVCVIEPAGDRAGGWPAGPGTAGL